jgi:hypothetical protein
VITLSNPLKIAAMRWAYASVNGVRIQLPWDQNSPQYGRYHYAFAKGTRQQVIGYTEGQCNYRDRWQIRNWMKGGNSDDMHVGIDCSGFVYRVLDEAAVMSGAPSLSQTLGTACEYTALDTLTPANQVLHRAMDVQSGDTMRFNRGHHSGVIIETVTDGQGVLKEIWYAHSSFTRGPHIGWVDVQDPEAPIEDAAQQWHDDMWDWLENNRLRDMYFESVHHSPFYQGARPRPAKVTGVSVTVGGSRVSFDVDPYVIGGRTMAQVRPLTDAMGASLSWDDNSQTITLTRGGRTVRCQVGSEVGVINNDGQLLDEPPVLVDDQVVAPVRFLAEGLGYRTDWDPALRYVTLTAM